MSDNSFGHLFRFTTWGESHGPAIGCVVDGCPPRIPLSEADIQPWLDSRRPGQSRFVTQRQEPDQVRILSGVFEGADHRHADRAASSTTSTSARATTARSRTIPPRPCRLHLRPEIRHARLSRRRPALGARDGGARGRRRHRPQGAAARTWRSAARWCRSGPHRIDRARWDWDGGGATIPSSAPTPAAAALGGLSRRRAQARQLVRRGDRGGGRGRRRRASAIRSTTSSTPTSPRR